MVLIDKIHAAWKEILTGPEKAAAIRDERKKAGYLSIRVKVRMNEPRARVDERETLVNDEPWRTRKKSKNGEF